MLLAPALVLLASSLCKIWSSVSLAKVAVEARRGGRQSDSTTACRRDTNSDWKRAREMEQLRPGLY